MCPTRRRRCGKRPAVPRPLRRAAAAHAQAAEDSQARIHEHSWRFRSPARSRSGRGRLLERRRIADPRRGATGQTGPGRGGPPGVGAPDNRSRRDPCRRGSGNHLLPGRWGGSANPRRSRRPHPGGPGHGGARSREAEYSLDQQKAELARALASYGAAAPGDRPTIERTPEVQKAEAELSQTKQAYDRAEELHKRQLVPKQTLDDAETTLRAKRAAYESARQNARNLPPTSTRRTPC